MQIYILSNIPEIPWYTQYFHTCTTPHSTQWETTAQHIHTTELQKPTQHQEDHMLELVTGFTFIIDHQLAKPINYNYYYSLFVIGHFRLDSWVTALVEHTVTHWGQMKQHCIVYIWNDHLEKMTEWSCNIYIFNLCVKWGFWICRVLKMKKLQNVWLFINHSYMLL